MPTTNYIWDDQNYLAETDGGNVVQTVYTIEPQQYGNLVSTRISSTASYHHFDAIGSTRQITNAARTVTDAMIYDAWGSIVARMGATQLAFLWLGELGYYWDPEVSQQYVRARSYSPATARWTSVDPLSYVDSASFCCSPYIYSVNRPSANVDASGALSVLPLGKDLKERKRCEGSDPVYQQWDFQLATPRKFPKPRLAKYKNIVAYIVQHITVKCQYYKCDSDQIDDSFDYYEAWPVNENKVLPFQRYGSHPESTYTDVSSYDPSELAATRGTITATGEIKVFSIADTNGSLNDDDAWTKKPKDESHFVQYGKGPICQSTPGFLNSTQTKPSWWDDKAIEGPKTRSFTVTWCCCGMGQPFIKPTAEPTK